MDDIRFVERETGQVEIEKVYGGACLTFLYGQSFLSKTLGNVLKTLAAYFPFFSSLYGYLQTCAFSKRKIVPFMAEFKVDESEFLDSVSTFKSFNDFFIRKLKHSSRPIARNKKTAIIPADGRYYFFQNVSDLDHFFVKGQAFSLSGLLNNPTLAEAYRHGSMVIARLCPSDYHRFHFPCDCTPAETQLINGYLFSVNPIAIKQNLDILWQNKRTFCELDSIEFGKILYLEIGATNVGTIQETYQPHQSYLKGDEKGYFSFGGSCLILLFPPESIVFDADLLAATKQGMEIRCLMGQSMGISKLGCNS